jgi:hypothetical protein
MVGYVFPMQYSPSHRWADAFKQFNVTKVGVYNRDQENPNFLTEQVKRVKFKNKQTLEWYDPESPFKNSLVTYLGFYIKPMGVMFRDMDTKDFRSYKFYNGKAKFYVSQKFDENVYKFRYGDTIVLLEGVLDVEAFSHLTNHPYVVGYLTSGVNQFLAAFLCSLTNKFLIVPDNDAVGKDILPKTMKVFKTFGVVPTVLETEQKDFGDVWSTRCELDVMKAKQILSII